VSSMFEAINEVIPNPNRPTKSVIPKLRIQVEFNY
jgi:hypothetical protein